MIPDFRILADGALVTLAMQTRLLSLTVTDEDGDKADRLQIDLDDPMGLIALPPDAILSVALGFKGLPLADMGRFAVDGMSGRHPAQTFSITATAANLKGDIRSPKTRAFEGKTLKDIVATIAGEAGLKPLVSESIAASRWDYLAQTAESNLHFLSRIARTLDATAKAAGGALIVQRRGDGLTAAGDALIPPILMQSGLTSWDWELDGRAVYKSVQAEYSDTGGGQVQSVIVGEGTPALRLRHVHANLDEARRACTCTRFNVCMDRAVSGAVHGGCVPRRIGQLARQSRARAPAFGRHPAAHDRSRGRADGRGCGCAGGKDRRQVRRL